MERLEESKKQEFRANPLNKTEHPASERKMHDLKESKIAVEGKHHNGSQNLPARALGVQH